MDQAREKISIQFLGAAGTVTGSRFLLQIGEMNVLVDCGMFQGDKKLREMNWEPFPFPPAHIHLVLLTHGHLDHTGYLPRLIKEGFIGEIWGTQPTLDITKIILEDSACIQEEDAERANREGYSKHNPAEPLYSVKDVESTLPHLVAKPPHEWNTIAKGITCCFSYNGHILGACFLEIKVGERVIVFSGDIGRQKDDLLYPPLKPIQADVVVIESTYGDRLHQEGASEQLEAIINKAAESKGTVIIPSFAVERTQLLVYILSQLKVGKHISDLPVYVDSPMASGVFDLFTQHPAWHKLSAQDYKDITRNVHQVRSLNETRSLLSSAESKIIIAGSGMATGGRVLYYFAQYLGDPKAVIIMAGFQAEGTRGRALLDGATEIKLFGKNFRVRAKISSIQGLSAHADQQELTGWLSAIHDPKHVFLVHGEPPASLALKQKIADIYGWNSEIPVQGQTIDLF